jgi:hypothetical protein
MMMAQTATQATVTYHRKDNRISFERGPGGNVFFSAECSTLFGPRGDIPTNMILVVPASGSSAVLSIQSRMIDREGELLGWKYVGYHKGRVIRFTLFND